MATDDAGEDKRPSKRKKSPSGEADRQLSQSLERRITILRSFTAGDSQVGIRDLAQRTGLTSPTVRRYVAALLELEYLEQDPAPRYGLGLRITALGLSALRARDLGNLALGELRALRKKTCLAVGFAVLDDLDIVYLERLRGTPRAPEAGRHLGAGSRLPAYRTAAGKVLLAHLAERQLSDKVQRLAFEGQAAPTRKARRLFLDELAEVREQGLAMDDEESLPGMVTVATPVFDETERIFAAVDISGPQARISMRALLNRHAPALTDTSRRISSLVGSH